MRKGHPWDDLIFRALRHAWLFDAYSITVTETVFKYTILFDAYSYIFIVRKKLGLFAELFCILTEFIKVQQ